MYKCKSAHPILSILICKCRIINVRFAGNDCNVIFVKSRIIIRLGHIIGGLLFAFIFIVILFYGVIPDYVKSIGTTTLVNIA